MSGIDWIVLISTLGFIAIYGAIKTRKQTNLNEYILGEQSLSWWKVGLGVMATQASAITFISTTGQGYFDGMRFVQFYFGLPLAMIVICMTFIPMFYKEKVFTAYEYLEKRFDVKTRTLAALIFLIQRGLAAGITIYAPAIILSTMFSWDLQLTIISSGILVILYTVSGGSSAVSVTQMQQMFVILVGMLFIFFFIIYQLPDNVDFFQALRIAGNHDKMQVVNFRLNYDDRYNVWAGLTGGFFLALAYFGTDQSQVQRYLSGKNPEQAKKGLIMNGILKIPMQFFILFCGVLLYVFLQYQTLPVSFNTQVEKKLQTQYPEKYNEFKENVAAIQTRKSDATQDAMQVIKDEKTLRTDIQNFVKQTLPQEESNDKDYVFLYFIMNYLPNGLIGLLIAVILCAAMSSISAELNALSGTTTIDIFKRFFSSNLTEQSEVNWTKGFTILWGVIAIGFALTANLFENLIQFINIIGSLFYGTVLGIFLVAFYSKTVKSNAVFISALIAQAVIFLLFFYSDLGFLWYNVIACGIVFVCSYLIQIIDKSEKIKVESRK